MFQLDIQNGHEIMPIITPIFPHKNAAYTVRPSSRDIVVKELQRGKSALKSERW